MLEVTYNTIRNAYEKSPEIERSGEAWKDYERLKYPHTVAYLFDWDYETAANGIRYIMDILDDYENSVHGYSWKSQVAKCKECMMFVAKFLFRKSKQRENFRDEYQDRENNADKEMFNILKSLSPEKANEWMENHSPRIAFDQLVDILGYNDDQARDLLSKLSENTKEVIAHYYFGGYDELKDFLDGKTGL